MRTRQLQRRHPHETPASAACTVPVGRAGSVGRAAPVFRGRLFRAPCASRAPHCASVPAFAPCVFAPCASLPAFAPCVFAPCASLPAFAPCVFAPCASLPTAVEILEGGIRDSTLKEKSGRRRKRADQDINLAVGTGKVLSGRRCVPPPRAPSQSSLRSRIKAIDRTRVPGYESLLVARAASIHRALRK